MGNTFTQSHNIEEEEVETGNSIHIPESAQDKIYNSIVRIEIGNNNSYGSGFFLKLNIKNQRYNCLITCSHVISKRLIYLNEEINLFYGKKSIETKKTIKLDRNIRIIKYFEKPADVTIVQIIESDKIPDDKFLLPDINYKNDNNFSEYINNKVLLAGYPNDIEFQKDRHISAGKITRIFNNFEFQHHLHTETGSSGSPLCLLSNQHVIGIHKKGKKREKINYGTFIGYILDKLEKNEDDLDNEGIYEIIKINPFQILNITEKDFREEYYSYNDIKKLNKKRFLAYFILENNNRYDREGNIFLVEKNHFYYTIMNEPENLKNILEKNHLAIYDTDNFGRTLLFLSVLGNNYETVEYLLGTDININEWDENLKTPLDIAEGKIIDLLVSNGGLLYENVFINAINYKIYQYPLRKCSDSFDFIEFIYNELIGKKLVIKNETIKKGNEEVGIRMIRNTKDELKNKDLNYYKKVYHGTKYCFIEPILKYGLKKPNKPLKGHISLNLTVNNIDNWANAIFVSPSIFYASSFSDCLASNNCIYHILIEGIVKSSSFTLHKSTIRNYKYKEGEPKKELEYRMINGKEKVIVTSLLFVRNEFIENSLNYRDGNIFL